MLLSAATLLGAVAVARQDNGRQDAELPPLPEGVEVLTRGPVHEAFAEPIPFDPEPGVFAPKAPPEPIQEMPPELKPEGENVVWVPGYWAWDDEREDFLWVSGIWRDIPPGRQWVPGYWEEADAGRYQWVPGYWIDAELEEAVYLPEPPASLEEGPSAPQPSPQHAWSPGCWYWVNEQYVWRPGYWFELRPDWVWVPPHYVWTPAGCIFVAGYWDYLVPQRGLLFAPVAFTQPVFAQPQFVYTPTVAIRESVLVDHFWVRPNYGHYYFGDYYEPVYQERGFAYWAEPIARPAVYDPIFVQRNFLFQQQDPGWITAVREAYRLRLRDEGFRPPRTFAAQRRLLARRADTPAELLLAAPLAALAAGRDGAPRPNAGIAAVLARAEARRGRLERIDEARRTELARRSISLREFQRERRQLETQLAADFRNNRVDRTRDAQVKAAQAERIEGVPKKAAARERVQGKAQSPRAVRLNRSPLAAKAAARRGPDGSPVTPPPPPGPRPDRDRPDAAKKVDRPGLPKADRPEFPKAGRRDLPKGDRPDLPKAAPSGPGRTERMRPPFPNPGAQNGPGRDRPKADRPGLPKADRPGLPKADRPGLPKADRPGAPRPDIPKKADRPSLPKAEGRGLPNTARPDRPKAPDVPGPARTERMRPSLPTPGKAAGPGRNPPGPAGGLRPGRDPLPGTGAPRPGGVGNPNARPDFPKAQPKPDLRKVQPRPPGDANRPRGPAGRTPPGADDNRPRLGNDSGRRKGGPPERPKAQPKSDRPDPGDAKAKGKAQGKRQRKGND